MELFFPVGGAMGEGLRPERDSFGTDKNTVNPMASPLCEDCKRSQLRIEHKLFQLF